MPEFWDLNTPGGAAKAIAAGLMDAPKEDPPREVSTPAGEEGAGSPEDTGRIEFEGQCGMYGLPRPEFEYKFAKARKWRFDIAFPELKIAIEQQGGLFTGGRHVRGAALLKEYEKLNHAALFGYRVLFFQPGEIADGTAARFVAKMMGGTNHA